MFELKLYNTLTGQKERFEPAEPDRVRIYVCGPTVYDMAHIGHARAYVAFDVVVRTLRRHFGEVKHARNYTDVDDKIIRRANEVGESPERIAERYTEEFLHDMDALGVERPDVAPKVTEHIGEIVRLVERLIETGFAYAAGGDVYYRVRRFDGYGKLSKRRLDDMEAGARVEPGEQKEDALDFALWKGAKPGEPSWDSPWGKGRPGWHIECSAMSAKHLGETFDIHGGGKDLIFPHHENEIAQSEAATGAVYARFWMHNGFVNIDDEKMSKSLGNFFTVREVLKRFHPQVLRAFLLAVHYRCSRRQRYQRQTRSGSRRNASGVASSSGSYFSQRPLCASRKVGTPLSAETPAPVSTQTCRASRSAPSRPSGSGGAIRPRRQPSP
jgi:cysteinyl-tRNA synthetase